jgi:serine/threonine protein kinase
LAEKILVERMISELIDLGLYDSKTLERLDILLISNRHPAEISTRERAFTEQVFGKRVERMMEEGSVAFPSLARQKSTPPGDIVRCEVTKFLGYGNMGPVFAVSVGTDPYALKMYSYREIQEMIAIHGKFGLAGLLQDIESQDQPDFLSRFGEKVLAKKPKGVYARSKKIVKIHNVGKEGEYIYLLMDLLAVDTINRVSPADLGADISDILSWAIDCATGLCHLHVEDRRLHLNVRPEAFVVKELKGEERLPKYSFFHFPQQFLRPKTGPCMSREFVLVDHLDTSVDVADRGAKGLGTVGSWLFVPPEVILQLLKALKEDYTHHHVQGEPYESLKTIQLRRSQMDDIWALGLTLYQFLSDGKLPFRDPKSLTDMINAILLSKFEFSHIHPTLRGLLADMLNKDPNVRFQKIMDGCPDKIKTRKVLAEAILYKLEVLGLNRGN